MMRLVRYNATGYMAQAAGAVTSGLAVEYLQLKGGPFPQLTDLQAYQCVTGAALCVGRVV